MQLVTFGPRLQALLEALPPRAVLELGEGVDALAMTGPGDRTYELRPDTKAIAAAMSSAGAE